MFERFTERARQVVTLAQEESKRDDDLAHPMITTGHFLLALRREEESVASRVLIAMGYDYDKLRGGLPKVSGEKVPEDVLASSEAEGRVPFTTQAKRVLELSLREALSLGHNYIGTEHLLLGILRHGDGDAIAAFVGDGHAPADVREAVMSELVGRQMKSDPPPPRTARLARIDDLEEQVGLLREKVEQVNVSVDLAPFANVLNTVLLCAMKPERIERAKAERLVRDSIEACFALSSATYSDETMRQLIERVLDRNPDVEPER